MSTVRVIAGSLKGRAIPFDVRKFDDADITTQKIKEAVFSMIGPGISGMRFCDLFGGSGQMAIEAVSRGAGLVFLCEADRGRFEFVRDFAASIGILKMMRLYHNDFRRQVRLFHRAQETFDVIFCDPPYDACPGFPPYLRDCIDVLEKSPVLSFGGTLIIQHHGQNRIPERSGFFTLIDTRRYGKSAVSRYRFTGGPER